MGTLLHVRRKSKRGGRAREVEEQEPQIKHMHTRVYFHVYIRVSDWHHISMLFSG
jgi:hypothetical protein